MIFLKIYLRNERYLDKEDKHGLASAPCLAIMWCICRLDNSFFLNCKLDTVSWILKQKSLLARMADLWNAPDLVQGLVELAKKFPITDIRGRGLMVAVEFGGLDGGLSAKAGTASAITKAAGNRNMLLLSAGKPYARHAWITSKYGRITESGVESPRFYWGTHHQKSKIVLYNF